MATPGIEITYSRAWGSAPNSMIVSLCIAAAALCPTGPPLAARRTPARHAATALRVSRLVAAEGPLDFLIGGDKQDKEPEPKEEPPPSPPAAPAGAPPGPPTAMAADIFAGMSSPIPLDSPEGAEALARLQQAEQAGEAPPGPAPVGAPPGPPTAMAADLFAGMSSPIPLDSPEGAAALERLKQEEGLGGAEPAAPPPNPPPPPPPPAADAEQAKKAALGFFDSDVEPARSAPEAPSRLDPTSLSRYGADNAPAVERALSRARAAESRAAG